MSPPSLTPTARGRVCIIHGTEPKKVPHSRVSRLRLSWLRDWSTDCLTARLGAWLVGRWVDCWLADPLVAKTNVKRCLFSRIFHFDCAPDDGGSCGSFVVVAGVSLSRSPCGNMQLLLLLLLQPLGYCLFTHVSITQSASRRGNIIWGPT